MIPIIYDGRTEDFNNYGIGVLLDTLNCSVTEQRNGSFELELTYPTNGIFYEYLKGQNIIKAKADNFRDPQLFRIYKTSSDIDNQIIVNAEHITYKLKDNFIEDMQYTGSIQSIMSNFFKYSTELVGFDFSSTYQGTFTVNYSLDNILSLLISNDNSILNLVGENAFINRDNFKVSIEDKSKSNNVLVAYRKNMTGFKCEEDWSNAYSKIYPYVIVTSKDENDVETETRITIDGKYLLSDNQDKFVSPKILQVDCKDMFDKDEEITPQSLELKVLNYFERTGADKPTLTYDINLIDLSKTEEYKNYGLIDSININDTIIVRHELYDIDTTVKVIEVTYDSLEEEYTSIVVGEPMTNLANKFDKIDKVVDNVLDTTNKIKDTLVDNFETNFNGLKTIIKSETNESKNITIKNFEVEYYLSDSALAATGGEWSEVAPLWESKKYMWQRFKITYSDDAVKYFNQTLVEKSLVGNGIQFTDTEGNTKYLHIIYSTDPENKNLTKEAGARRYIGIYADDTLESSTDSMKYNWFKLINSYNNHGGFGFKISDNQYGYLHIKYSDDNGATFTKEKKVDLLIDDSTVVGIKTEEKRKKLNEEFQAKEFGETFGTYMGYYISFVQEDDSSDKNKYTWELIKELNVSSIENEYQLSDDINTYNNSNWSSSKPTHSADKYIFVRTKVNYNDNSSSYCNVYGDSSYLYYNDIISQVDNKMNNMFSIISKWDGSQTTVNNMDSAKADFKEYVTKFFWSKTVLDRLGILIDKLLKYLMDSIKDYVTKATMDKAIENISNAITGNDGGYIRLNPPSNPSELLVIDNEDLNLAKTVWRWNKSGLGVSRNGYNGEFFGLTKDGKLVIDDTTTNTLQANFIKTQVIENISTGNEYFKINSTGAKFGNLSTGNYTEITENGTYRYIGGNKMGYISVTWVEEIKIHFNEYQIPLEDWQHPKVSGTTNNGLTSNYVPGSNLNPWKTLDTKNYLQDYRVEWSDKLKSLLNGKSPNQVLILNYAGTQPDAAKTLPEDYRYSNGAYGPIKTDGLYAEIDSSDGNGMNLKGQYIGWVYTYKNGSYTLKYNQAGGYYTAKLLIVA